MFDRIIDRVAKFVAERVTERMGSARSRYTVVAHGRQGNVLWAAVPLGDSPAFCAEFPTAIPCETFCQIMLELRDEQPRTYQFMLPFAAEVIEAHKRYVGRCHVFVVLDKS